jgi:hypothetical protein
MLRANGAPGSEGIFKAAISPEETVSLAAQWRRTSPNHYIWLSGTGLQQKNGRVFLTPPLLGVPMAVLT